jgi:PIN domain nuclease of toxin-antitoxin system
VILIDTHVLAWILLVPQKLSAPARAALDGATGRAVSAASLYEMALKNQLGKWPEIDRLLEHNLTDDLTDLGFEILPATGPIMQMAGHFEWAHRDPFDRLIMATALIHDLPLISADQTLDTCPVSEGTRLW